MWDFADETENGILCCIIELACCVFCSLAIIIQEIHKKDGFNKRKHGTRME